MQSYISLILDELQGDTPKEKFEALKKLQSERTTYWSKANHAHENFKALLETPGMEPFQSILSALANITNLKPSIECHEYLGDTPIYKCATVCAQLTNCALKRHDHEFGKDEEFIEDEILGEMNNLKEREND
jgi:hypothetical protein